MDTVALPSVVVVDDDDAGRESLCWLIESVGLNIKAFATPTEFLSSPEAETAGCLVLDLRLPEHGGLDVLQMLRDHELDIPTIMITAFGDIHSVVRAFRLGAVDFLQKPFSDQELIDRIQKCIEDDARHREVEGGRRYIRERIDRLTARERQVLDSVLAGKQNKQIAYEMDISPKTVEAHRAKVMEKTEASSLVKLVRMVTILEPESALSA